MKPFQQGGRDSWMARVRTPEGEWTYRALGTKDPVVAGRICAMGTYLEEQKAVDVLDRITSKKPSLSLADCYDLWLRAPSARKTKAAKPIPASDDERLEFVRERLNTVLLAPLIVEWARTADPRYVIQVRTLYPKDTTATITDFSAHAISRHFAMLSSRKDEPLGVVTLRKYRAAFADLATWMLHPHRMHIQVNPAASVPLEKVEMNTDPVFPTEDEAKTLILSLSGDQRALEAMLHSTGMEMQAAKALHARDVDVEHRMIFADGGKTSFRRRWVEVTEDWCWEIIRDFVAGFTPAAPLFPLRHDTYLRRHNDAVARLKLSPWTLHHYRHGHAVMWIQRGALGGLRRDGKDAQWLKAQLGHSPRSTLLHTTYGVYVDQSRLTERHRMRMAEADAAHAGTNQAPAAPVLTLVRKTG